MLTKMPIKQFIDSDIFDNEIELLCYTRIKPKKRKFEACDYYLKVNDIFYDIYYAVDLEHNKAHCEIEYTNYIDELHLSNCIDFVNEKEIVDISFYIPNKKIVLNNIKRYPDQNGKWVLKTNLFDIQEMNEYYQTAVCFSYIQSTNIKFKKCTSHDFVDKYFTKFDDNEIKRIHLNITRNDNYTKEQHQN